MTARLRAFSGLSGEKLPEGKTSESVTRAPTHLETCAIEIVEISTRQRAKDATNVTRTKWGTLYHDGMDRSADTSVTPSEEPKQRNTKGRGNTIKPTPMFHPEVPDRTALCVPLASLHLDPDQPRQTFDDASLQELAASLLEHGVLQPILVCRLGQGYRVVAGERRYRAATLAGLGEVPVRIVADHDVLELQLVENLQREDLNPYEEAVALARLKAEKDLSVRDLAARLHLSKSRVDRRLQILEMPDELQEGLKKGELGYTDALRLAKERQKPGKTPPASPAGTKPRSPFVFSRKEDGAFKLTVSYRPEQDDKKAVIEQLEQIVAELKRG